MDKLLTPLSIIIAGGLIGLSIIYSDNPSILGTKSILQKTDIQEISDIVANDTNAPSTLPTPVPSIREVNLDDDAVLGSADAPVTIIEFSDYECPFCKSYFTNTFPNIKKDYVDTGKVKIVFRDFPLGFHDPLATTEAMAVECARKQGGDKVYFEFHDKVFAKTNSNGNGLLVTDLYTIATDLGLNSTELQNCVESKEFEEEVKADLAYGSSIGISGTPSFYIGKSGDKTIKGELIVGAQPFATFQQAIDKYLEQ